ncbi:MAG: hypothetical protein IJQ05_00410 [Bacteroidaceae bacterium]|nr:hypothetical protein [Bacteroidaceae bacterium]
MKYFLTAICLITSTVAFAQNTENEPKYRRSSLYSLMINHTDQKFASEIRNSFLNIPIPDKYNDHDLSVKVVDINTKLKNASSNKENEAITTFLNDNQIAGRMVAKWFNRDKYTGACDMELVKERGLYNANEFDKQIAARSARGISMLQDAGEDLIGNTFVLVNDISYVDKAKKGMIFGGIIKALGSVAQAYTGVNVSSATNLIGDIAESIRGFSVKINTFLYKLSWNDEIANNFYETQYTDSIDTDKAQNFESNRGNYQLVYVGKVESSGSTTSWLGVKLDTPANMVRKACQRAIDENIVDLQTQFEEFRTKTPLLSIEPLTADIGMKEGVSIKSRFEVLDRVEQKDSTYKYVKVAEIAPVEDMIWDNRYMAVEEGAKGANLGKTTFKKVKGGDIFPGMLIREIK